MPQLATYLPCPELLKKASSKASKCDGSDFLRNENFFVRLEIKNYMYDYLVEHFRIMRLPKYFPTTQVFSNGVYILPRGSVLSCTVSLYN